MTKKTSEKKIMQIKILRANGMTYEDIAELLDVSESTASKYSQDVAILPKSKQRNPFSSIGLKNAEAVADARIPTAENRIIAEEIGDVDYWVEEQTPGRPFAEKSRNREHLIDKIELKDLQKLMDEPTNYNSPLSLGDWCKYYLEGRGTGKILTKKPHTWNSLQFEMFELWQKYRRLMIEVFRNGGKTMVGLAVNINQICENIDNNYFFMSESKLKAARRVKAVGDVLLTNKRIIADYGFLPHINKYEGKRGTWKMDELKVKRNFSQTDATLTALSIESTEATGAHVAGITYDDIWSIKHQGNPQKYKDKFFSWRDQELEGCLENAWEIYLLTRKGVTDVYKELEDSGLYMVYKKPAFPDNKYPSNYEVNYLTTPSGKKVIESVTVRSDDYKLSCYDHHVATADFLMFKKLKMRHSKFMSEYQLDPIPESGKYLDWKKLNWIESSREWMAKKEKKKLRKRMVVHAFLDLATGTSDRADFSALSVVGKFDNNWYFLQTYVKRGATDSDLVKMCRSAHREFSPLLSSIHVEADFHQSRMCRRLNKKTPFIILVPFMTRQEQRRIEKQNSGERKNDANLTGKPLRIWRQIEPIMNGRQLWVNKQLRHKKEFRDEWDSFPDCDHFDILDSLGNCISITNKKGALLYAISG